MLSLDTLRVFGANVEEGLGRCMNNEAFYLKLVKMAVADDKFPQLEAGLAEHDLDKAFQAAHAMKGVYGNLAITPLLTPVSAMTELLRSRTETDYSALLQEAKAQHEKFLALVND